MLQYSRSGAFSRSSIAAHPLSLYSYKIILYKSVKNNLLPINFSNSLLTGAVFYVKLLTNDTIPLHTAT